MYIVPNCTRIHYSIVLIRSCGCITRVQLQCDDLILDALSVSKTLKNSRLVLVHSENHINACGFWEGKTCVTSWISGDSIHGDKQPPRRRKTVRKKHRKLRLLDANKTDLNHSVQTVIQQTYPSTLSTLSITTNLHWNAVGQMIRITPELRNMKIKFQIIISQFPRINFKILFIVFFLHFIYHPGPYLQLAHQHSFQAIFDKSSFHPTVKCA